MARKPNYQFERRERERVKAAKKAAKAELKRRKTEDAAGGGEPGAGLNGGLKPESD
jgi:hypothetical protein